MQIAIETPKQRSEQVGRREMLGRACWGIWLFISGLPIFPALSYLFSTPKRTQGAGWRDAGDINRVPVNRPVHISFEQKKVDAWEQTVETVSAWVVRSTERGLIVLGPQCTHLGCAHHWDDARKQFVCPCHNSAFSMEGTVLAGPAPRPLDRYQAKIESGRLMIGGLQPNEHA